MSRRTYRRWNWKEQVEHFERVLLEQVLLAVRVRFATNQLASTLCDT